MTALTEAQIARGKELVAARVAGDWQDDTRLMNWAREHLPALLDAASASLSPPDLDWFWRIVDEFGFEEVPSSEPEALQRICRRMRTAEAASLSHRTRADGLEERVREAEENARKLANLVKTERIHGQLAEAKGYARGLEAAADLCSTKSSQKFGRNANPEPADEPRWYEAQGVIASILADEIRALVPEVTNEAAV